MEMQYISCGVRTEFLNLISGTIIVILNIIHRPVFFLFKTQRFGDWIQSLSSAAVAAEGGDIIQPLKRLCFR
jgi:hypothetical protein